MVGHTGQSQYMGQKAKIKGSHTGQLISPDHESQDPNVPWSVGSLESKSLNQRNQMPGWMAKTGCQGKRWHNANKNQNEKKKQGRGAKP